jgi:hypothetical protein
MSTEWFFVGVFATDLPLMECLDRPAADVFRIMEPT